MSEAAPGWLVAEVAAGLQRLLVLRLDGCPPADAVEAVALAWADALMVRGGGWQEALDAPRIREAFRRLAAHAMRWPAPAEIWQHMPARPEPPKLPAPPPSEEERARAMRMLAELREKMRIPI
ncbi:hypothetical protein [Pelomicrobium methylotrophicum]|uniref:Uncharacterized protein n=1 Tax=Pelomicrobium methylotrophicum TaxID=2602750 RepID=A0A5C7EV03_9PROT|nr:hypothetical protein [Pelomicrobium methylotrophicum]TXF11907.1 hypothetical protein FR698_07845 [Pelomicrobium methylotrophicum]